MRCWRGCLPPQQREDVPLAVADRDHPRARAGPAQLHSLLEPFHPALALLAPDPLRYRLEHFQARPRPQPVHPQGTPPLRQRQARMHEKSVRRPRSPADRAQPLRALAQPLVVQRRGVLHQQYRRFQGAALGHGLAVRLQDVVHRHARARQQPVRRVPVVALGKHRRQVRARTAVPRLAHDKQQRPHARVKVVRPRELAHAPVLAGPPPRQEGTEMHSQEWNAGPERSCAPTRCMRTGTESSLGRGRFAALNHRPNERFDLVRPLHTSLLERITLTSRSRRNSRPTAWTRSGSAPTRDPIRSVQGICRRHRSAPAT